MNRIQLLLLFFYSCCLSEFESSQRCYLQAPNAIVLCIVIKCNNNNTINRLLLHRPFFRRSRCRRRVCRLLKRAFIVVRQCVCFFLQIHLINSRAIAFFVHSVHCMPFFMRSLCITFSMGIINYRASDSMYISILDRQRKPCSLPIHILSTRNSCTLGETGILTKTNSLKSTSSMTILHTARGTEGQFFSDFYSSFML